jgi:hypothetical protein
VAEVEAWGWTPGLVPDDSVPVLPMEDMRDIFIRTFSSVAGETN